MICHTLRGCLRPSLISLPIHSLLRRTLPRKNWFSTLDANQHIKVFQNCPAPSVHLLSYLETEPPSPELAIGTTTAIPPTPRSFKENPRFLSILNEVLVENAHNDPALQSEAKVFAGPGGTSFLRGTPSTPPEQAGRQANSSKMGAETGAGGASAQGGAGGAHRGGHVHLSDSRNPPNYGRIAWPEDILGSVEVDSDGTIVGRLEPSGTYRILTNEGILGISPFLREKIVERLRQEEHKTR